MIAKNLSKSEIICSIRVNMAALGHPIDDLTDKDIENGILIFGKLVAKIGITSEEAAQMIKQLGIHGNSI